MGDRVCSSLTSNDVAPWQYTKVPCGPTKVWESFGQPFGLKVDRVTELVPQDGFTPILSCTKHSGTH